MITAVLVAVIFVCIMFPHLVRKRHHFYTAIGMILLAIAVHSIGAIFGVRWAGIEKFLDAVAGVMDAVGFVLLILATGGLSLHELTGQMSEAIQSFGHEPQKPAAPTEPPGAK